MELLARDIMVTKLVTLRPEQDIFDAIDVLLKKKISGAPVVTGNKLHTEVGHKIVGILSEKDCLRILAHHDMLGLPGGQVKDYMTESVVSVPPDMDIFRVAALFLGKSYRRLPVIDNGLLIGQISRRDVLAGIQKMRDPNRGRYPDYRRPA